MSFAITRYKASPTATKFHKDKSFVRLILGPVGSGKSVACVMEVFLKAISAPVSLQDNTRYSRIFVVRNTMRDLRDTTLNTYKRWVDITDDAIGYWREMHLTHHLRFRLPDDTKVHCDVVFRGLDTPADIKKLYSLEATWIFFNECRFIDEDVFATACERVGRYPEKETTGRKLVSGNDYGIFMDTNPPDTDHWIYHKFEQQQLKGYAIFHQPSGRSPEAENIENLPENYYDTISIGKDPEWVKVFVDGQYGLIKTGLPVYPMFQPTLHIERDDDFEPSIDIVVGIDFGLTPAAAFITFDPYLDTWFVFDELVAFNMGSMNFGKLLKEHIHRTLKPLDRFNITFVGDPAGLQQSQVDERTPFDGLAVNGIDALPCVTQDPEVRKESVRSLLNQLSTVTHQPRLMFPCPDSTPVLIKGLSGGYQYRRLQVSGEARYSEKPLKNKFSHVVEALEYGLVNSGVTLTDQIISRGSLNKPIDYSKLNRQVV